MYGLNSKMEKTQEIISELEDRIEITQSDQQREKRLEKKNEQSFRGTITTTTKI